MLVPFTGGCACGAIRYECSAEPLGAGNCHCRDCQRASGSAYSSWLAVPTSALRLLKGEMRYYHKRAASGRIASRGFCSDCGSPILSKEESAPDVLAVQAGSLDDPSGHRPTLDMWTASAQPWDILNPALRKYDNEPTKEDFQELFVAPG